MILRSIKCEDEKRIAIAIDGISFVDRGSKAREKKIIIFGRSAIFLSGYDNSRVSLSSRLVRGLRAFFTRKSVESESKVSRETFTGSCSLFFIFFNMFFFRSIFSQTRVNCLFRRANLTLDLAAPVKGARASLDDDDLLCLVASSAAH